MAIAMDPAVRCFVGRGFRYLQGAICVHASFECMV